jgi:hypothetical protein
MVLAPIVAAVAVGRRGLLEHQGLKALSSGWFDLAVSLMISLWHEWVLGRLGRQRAWLVRAVDDRHRLLQVAQ